MILGSLLSGYTKSTDGFLPYGLPAGLSLISFVPRQGTVR